MRGQVETSEENPSNHTDIAINLLTNGFEPFPENDYFETPPEVAELIVNFDGDPRPFVKIDILGN